MSKYTTEVRYICETSTSQPIAGDGFNNVEEIIDSSHRNIFNFEYPIFDNSYRAVLQKKILRHFYTREICDETVGLWKLRMCDRLNVIMPYYNQLYESALLEFNPFYDTDYTRTGNVKDDKLSVDSENEISNKILANDVDKSSNSMKKSEMTTDKSKSGEQIGSNASDVESTTDNTSTSTVTSNKNDTSTSTVSSNTYDAHTSNVTSNKNDTYTSTVTSNKNDTYSASGTTNKNDTITGTTTNTETKTNSSSGNSTDKYSDTPQGSISDLANDRYLTNARMINKSDSSTDNLQGSVTKNETNSETGSVSNSGNNKTKYDSNTKDKNNTEYESDTKDENNTDYKSDISDENNTVYKSNTSDTNNTTYESHISGTDSKDIHETERVDNKDVENEINKVKESGNASENYNKKGNRSGSVKNLNEYAEKVIGKMGGASYSKMLNEFRSTFLNIDAMILKDLEPLFFGLW